MRRALAQAPGRGVHRIVTATRTHLQEVASTGAFRMFLAAETATAHRVLWGPDGVHSRYVRLRQELLQQAAEQGELDLPHAADDAAQLLMAVAQVVAYEDLLNGQAPDWQLLTAALTALLRGPRGVTA